MKRIAASACLIGAVACGKPSTTPTPSSPPSSASSPTATTVRTTAVSGASVTRSVVVEDRFVPATTVQELKQFVAEVPANESGGECMLSRTRGNGALTATAFYPTRLGSNTQVSVTFDSAGHVVRYSEMRGVPHIKPGLRSEQVDSARRAVEDTLRSTSISFDYPVDRGFALNRGGGKPTNAVTSSVRDMENLEALGRPMARMERMRKLCGV